MTFHDLLLIYIAGYLSAFLTMKIDLRINYIKSEPISEIMKYSLLSWFIIPIYLYFFIIDIDISKWHEL